MKVLAQVGVVRFPIITLVISLKISNAYWEKSPPNRYTRGIADLRLLISISSNNSLSLFLSLVFKIYYTFSYPFLLTIRIWILFSICHWLKCRDPLNGMTALHVTTWKVYGDVSTITLSKSQNYPFVCGLKRTKNFSRNVSFPVARVRHLWFKVTKNITQTQWFILSSNVINWKKWAMLR